MSGYTIALSTEIRDGWKSHGDRVHSLHSLCSRTGSFPPAMARYFVLRYSKPGDTILDPFSGKGTLPLEACLNGRRGIGNDVAPEAYVLTRSKVNAVSFAKIQRVVSEIKEVWRPDHHDPRAEIGEVRVFFSDYALRQILAIRELLSREDSDTANFLKASMIGILHGPSSIHLSVPCSHSFSMSPGYVRRYSRTHRLMKPRREVLDCLVEKCRRVLSDGLPAERGKATMRDALSLPLDNDSVHLIVTSPPYFNMQTYAWDNWLRLWFLGYSFREVRSRLFQSQSEEKFTDFMRGALEEMFRVLKNGAHCFVILGKVRINGRQIDMAEMLAPEARDVGFQVIRIIRDDIPKSSKYLMYIGAKQGVNSERILELRKPNGAG